MSLVGRWPLQDSGNNRDIIAYIGPNGYITNTGSIAKNTNQMSVAGPGGDLPRAIAFDGITGNFILLPPINLIKSSNEFSVSVWAKLPNFKPITGHRVVYINGTSGNGMPLLDINLGNVAQTGASVNLVYRHTDVTSSTGTASFASSPTSFNDWRLWSTAVKYASGLLEVRRYLDGNLFHHYSQASSYTQLVNQDPILFTIGARIETGVGGDSNGTTAYSHLQLADLRIYNEAISDSEMSGIFDSSGNDVPPTGTGGTSYPPYIDASYTGEYQKIGNGAVWVHPTGMVINFQTNDGSYNHGAYKTIINNDRYNNRFKRN